MTTGTRTVARGAILTVALLATGMLVAGLRVGMPRSTAATSPPEPAPCVATVLPDAYYQAIAEMNACTGTNVTVEVPPADIRWAIRGDLPPPRPGDRVIVDP